MDKSFAHSSQILYVGKNLKFASQCSFWKKNGDGMAQSVLLFEQGYRARKLTIVSDLRLISKEFEIAKILNIKGRIGIS